MGLKLTVIPVHNNQVNTLGMFNLPFNLISHFMVSIILFFMANSYSITNKVIIGRYLNDINSIITVTSYIQKLCPEEEQAVS